MEDTPLGLLCAKVALEKTKFYFDTFFSYSVPYEFSKNVKIGSRVIVPFGKSNISRCAFVMELIILEKNDFDFELKEIISIVDEIPLVNEKILNIAKRMSSRYFCTVFDILSCSIPLRIKKNKINIEDLNKKKKEYEFCEIFLTEYQKVSFDKLTNWFGFSKKNEALLFGITGSGKTALFLKLAQLVVSKGQNVLILVPEISLIPQIVASLEKYFGKGASASFHSGLTPKQREIEWKKIKSGELSIAVGTRSAVFAPFEKLGLIVIDEEQEPTYKSESSPRFHARDVARFLCIQHKAKLLLVSATPSIESLNNINSNKMLLCKLEKRYSNISLPKVEILDMNKSKMVEKETFLSIRLIELISKNISKNKQVIILLDRRGFYTLVRCISCGTVSICKNCNVTLSCHFENENKNLMCHCCGFTCKIPKICLNCGSKKIVLTGVGTQNIEEKINQLVKSAKCLRVDADTTICKKSYEKMFKDFKDGKFNVMVGTRMIAKGLDFENVNLAAVIYADQGLFSPDYRANERTFSLITQIVGRSGRREERGTALIQTFSPDSIVLKLASEQNYEKFFKYEIILRKRFLYPPFADVCTIGFLGGQEKNTFEACCFFYEILKYIAKNYFSDIPLRILFPTPAILKKAFKKFRFKIIIKCKNDENFRKFITQVLTFYEKNNNIKSINTSLSVKKSVLIFVDINHESLF